jgi:hypothetical protein
MICLIIGYVCLVAGICIGFAMAGSPEIVPPARNTPEPLPKVESSRAEQTFAQFVDATQQWNKALLNVPIVKRPMVWKETRQ